jgi:DNA invertase Pin-like site-specific DNA recombinase
MYEETESAAKRRPVLEQLLEDARRGKVEAVIVWALDRLERSMVGAVRVVLELDRCAVTVLSVRDGWLDTAGPVRPLLIAIFGWVAEQERARLIERTRAGLQRARREGTRLGRPPSSPVLLGAAADRVAQGRTSIRAAARALGLSEVTLRRYLRRKGDAHGYSRGGDGTGL